MIQDIAPHIYHNEYHQAKPEETDCLTAVENDNLYMYSSGAEPEFLRFSQLDEETHRAVCQGELQTIFLFEVDGISFFLADPQSDSSHVLLDRLKKIKGLQLVSVQEFRRLRPMWKAFAGITAIQLHKWYSSRRYCGCCGSAMVKSKKERAMVCPACGQIEYPKICPAVIIGIVNKDKLMMTKYAGRGFKNYALVAGFTEIGESFEATVRREVMEEVGLKVKNITYYKSQPWGFTDTILAGFYCQLDGSEEYHVDMEELSEAEWISRDELPRQTQDVSLTSEMIEAFRQKTYPCFEAWEGRGEDSQEKTEI